MRIIEFSDGFTSSSAPTSTALAAQNSLDFLNSGVSGNPAASYTRLHVNSSGVLVVRNSGGTDIVIPTLTGTETLTNKSLQDSTTSFVDNSDATKKLQIQCSGITTATTRTMTVPDADFTAVGTATTQTLTNKTLTAPIVSDLDSTTAVTLPEIATPSTPASGKGKIYFKTDSKPYALNDGGTETLLVGFAAVSARAIGSSTTPTGGATMIWTTETYDTATAFDHSGTGIFTCPSAGKYLVTANISCANTSFTTDNFIAINRNGSTYSETQGRDSSNRLTLAISDIVSCSASDTLKITASFQTSSTLSGASSTCWVSISKVSD